MVSGVHLSSTQTNSENNRSEEKKHLLSLYNALHLVHLKVRAQLLFVVQSLCSFNFVSSFNLIAVRCIFSSAHYRISFKVNVLVYFQFLYSLQLNRSIYLSFPSFLL